MALTREQYLDKVPSAYRNNLYYKKYKEDPNFWKTLAEENTISKSWDYKKLPWDEDHDGVKAINKTQNKFYVQSKRTPNYDSWSPRLNQQPIYLDNDPENREWDVYLNSQGNPAFYPRAFNSSEKAVTPPPSNIENKQFLPAFMFRSNKPLQTTPFQFNSQKYEFGKQPPFSLGTATGDPINQEQIFDKAAQETRATGNTKIQSGGAGTNDQIPVDKTDTSITDTDNSITNQDNKPLQKYYPQWIDPYATSTGLTEQDTPEQSGSKEKYFDLDWNHLYDLAKSANAIGLAYKNWRIADAAERPILHDPVEHHHAVYGDYFAKTQGQQNAGNLLNAASRPITSDMAQTHASQLQSQIAANDAINQGNLVDNQKREQTAEVAWQQEKENKNNRHDVAMANRDAIYKADFNRADLKQQRNAYIHKEIENILGAWQKDYQDFRNERKKYQDLYDQEFAVTNGINNYIASNNINPNLKLRAHQYLYQPSTFNKWYSDASDEEKEQILDIIKGGTTQGHLDYYKNKGVRIQQAAQGGHLQKAILQKRQKDANRFAKQMEESNKRVQKAIFKSIDRMYRTKYQHGGGLVAFNSTPVRTPSETISPPYWHPLNTSSAGADKKKDSAGNKLSDLLKTAEALDNDRKVIDASIQKLMNLKDSGLDTSSLEAQALQIQSMIQKAKQSYDFKNKVAEKLQANGADKEAYIDTNGLVMVYDEGKGYSKVSAEEALQHQHIVTNAEALNYRNTNPNATFNSDLLQDLYASIGMPNIHTSIKNATESLGSTETFQRALGKIENGKLVGGSGSLLDLLSKEMKENGVSPTLAALDDGIFNMHNSYKTNTAQINSALSAILSSLSTQEQAFITLKATREGVSPEAYVLGLLKPKEEIKDNSDIDIDFQGQRDKSSDKEKELDSDFQANSMLRTIVKNQGKVMESIVQLDDFDKDKDSQGKVALKVKSVVGVTTVDESKVWSADKKTASTLEGTDMANFTNFNYSSFNGAGIADPNEVIILNNQFEVADLPSTKNADGLVVPDFDKWRRINTALTKINSDGGVSKVTEEGIKKLPFTLDDLNKVNDILTNQSSSPAEKKREILKLFTEEGYKEIQAALGQDLYTNYQRFMMYSAKTSNLAFNRDDLPIFGKDKQYENDPEENSFNALRLLNIPNEKYNKDKDITDVYLGKLYLPYVENPFHSTKSYDIKTTDGRMADYQGDQIRSNIHLHKTLNN